MSDTRNVYLANHSIGLARCDLSKALYTVQTYRSGQKDDELLQIAVDYLMQANGKYLYEAEKYLYPNLEKPPWESE